MFSSNRQKIFSEIVFGIYIVLLLWLILFKFATSIDEISHMQNINLIPFGDSTIINGQLAVWEILYNALVFVPFGVYMSLFHPKWSWVQKILPCLCLSILLEAMQFAFAIGASDITDVITNTLGGILGLILYRLFAALWKKHHIAVINGIGLAIEITGILLLLLLRIANG